MKRILGLDLGTNSIGWALIATYENGNPSKIEGMGSRIIPMSQDIIGAFDKGNSVSQTAERRRYRSARRLRERYLLRRERLHRVLNIMGFLPKHYSDQIDFNVHLGKFLNDKEPKLAYKDNRFAFNNSFEEMLNDFIEHQPQLLANGKKIPYDWTIYYLRKKALTEKIEKEELAWILLNFNQKRGYYQRDDQEDNEIINQEYVIDQKIVAIEKDEEDKKNKKKRCYKITLENGWVVNYATFGTEPAWLNTSREFLVTEELDENGNVKLTKERKTDQGGTPKRKITPLPSFEEIDLMTKKDQDRIYKKIKVKTESVINQSGKTVGTYIYETLLQKPNQKIKGKLIRTIDRHFYKEELQAILIAQKQFHPELQNIDLLNDSIRELYRNNEAHQLILCKRDFVYLFLDDIIFYQRPLKSKKSSVGKCSLEYRTFKDENGNRKIEYLRTIPKSHPLYQEFRIWQWLSNLKILDKENEQDETSRFINSIDEKEMLFKFMNDRKDIDQKSLFRFLLGLKGFKGKSLSTEVEKYRWNYVEDKIYPCNVTGSLIKTRLEKVGNVPFDFLTPEKEQSLWHIIYSVNDKCEFEKALKTFANKHNLDEDAFVANFKNFPLFKSEYGAFSEKAIKRLLPLLRIGKYWKWDSIDERTKGRITKILSGEYDEKIKTRVREKAIHLTKEFDFQGLQLWLAQYIVYDRHSEAASTGKWSAISDLEKYLVQFKQHSLRNPIVEQVISETLRVVRDIWVKFGNEENDFFSEIHVELGRQMKNTAEERERLTNQISENENTNLRIKALIAELKENSDGSLFVEDVRPYSPVQQEALKIYENGVLSSNIEIPEDILKISKSAQPSKSELQRYKLWLEQKYRSPYTGQMIPLNKLFTKEYEIEHIIPQSRYFDDSFSNKVICEASVNLKKENQLGLEFIKNHHGEKIDTGFGNTVEILSVEAFQDFVKGHYKNNRSKKGKLLLEEIPDKMIERQLNDTRYISAFIMNILSNIVRSAENDDGVNSKNLVPGNGTITSVLRQDWGLNDVWNEMILPRFERMNQLTNSTNFTSRNTSNKVIPTVPLEISKGFQKKRIDHRHHALDALVIACTTRDHVNLLNNRYAKSKERFDLNRKLRRFEKVAYQDFKTGSRIEREVPKEFLKPWVNFTKEAKTELEKVVVSFKQNLRVINKATNKYEKILEKEGFKIKEMVPQKSGNSWSIRKPLHTSMPYGKRIYEFDVLKICESVGKRKLILDRDIRNKVENLLKDCNGKVLEAQNRLKETPIKDNFGNPIIMTAFKVRSEKFRKRQDISRLSVRGKGGIKSYDDAVKFLNKIVDYKIREQLFKHLHENGNDIDLAFSAEGLERFNNQRKIPVNKLPIAESGSGRFKVGDNIGTRHKWVEAAEGNNLFFAIYQDKNSKRSFETIPLNIVIERQKQDLAAVPEVNDQGDVLLFYLSPNDLVYVPTKEERENINRIDLNALTKEQINRIFVVNDFSSTCYFTPNHFARCIASKEVDLNFDVKKKRITGSFDNKTASFEGVQIKEICLKLKIDRLGKISWG